MINQSSDTMGRALIILGVILSLQAALGLGETSLVGALLGCWLGVEVGRTVGIWLREMEGDRLGVVEGASLGN